MGCEHNNNNNHVQFFCQWHRQEKKNIQVSMFNSQSLQSRQLIQHIRQKKTGILALNPENQKENKNKKKIYILKLKGYMHNIDIVYCTGIKWYRHKNQMEKNRSILFYSMNQFRCWSLSFYFIFLANGWNPMQWKHQWCRYQCRWCCFIV